MLSIPVTIQSDEKGYFDRECPNEDCLYNFKISLKDWEEKVSEDEVHCPLCGHIDTSDKWWTQGQLSQVQEIAQSWALKYAQDELDKSFRKLTRSTRNSKYIKITYKPGKRITFKNNPIGQREEWETEICCEKCGTHYSVIGSAYFCPCCGYNSAVNSFSDSLNSIEKMIDSLEEMKTMLIAKYNVDTAETMSRNLLESTIGDIVSAFQKFASCKYDELSNRTSRVNDFQIVAKGSNLFEQISGKGYDAWLSSSELDFLNMMFQRRHLLEHNNGIVDQRYLDKSNDTSYVLGQRIIVKVTDAYSLLKVIRKLGDELMTLQRGGGDNGSNRYK